MGTSSLTMKVMGLFAITFAVCLLSMSVAQPLVFLDPISAATFTTAGGLVLTSAAGTVATIPTSTLALGSGCQEGCSAQAPVRTIDGIFFLYHQIQIKTKCRNKKQTPKDCVFLPSSELRLILT